MRALSVLCAGLLLAAPPSIAQITGGQQQSGSAPAPFTLKVNARIVFLDVTVLDKRNRPVTQGLSKDDFSIFEDHQPQPIYSFEGPEDHASAVTPNGDETAGQGPLTEIVLDRLNSTFPDFSYSEIALRRYLMAQPPQLKSPTELMLLDNTSFDLVQSYTRDRDELVEALDHISPALPLKISGDFFGERLLQSITALREIAFRNEGLEGRKNVLWLGRGTGVDLSGLPQPNEKLRWFSHDTTNALVNARISLFVMFPDLEATGVNFLDLDRLHVAGLNPENPFANNVGVGAFAYETGGTVLRGNWPDRLITQAQTYGSSFYTLMYRPPEGAADGHFRRVMVKMRDPNLHAITKIGYYDPDSKAPFNERQQQMLHVTSEIQSALPLDMLSVTVASVVRHTDTGTVELVLHLAPKNMQWQTGDEGKSRADLMLAAASLDRRREILASRLQDLPLTVDTQDRARLAGITMSVHLTLHVPRKTQTVRVVMESAAQNRAGSVEVPRAVIDAAKDAPTPVPKLIPRPTDPRAGAPS